MAMTDDDLTLLRSYVVWDPPTDETLNTRYDVLGSWPSVALEQVRIRRSQLLAGPASFSIGGEYSESNTANIEALTKMMDELEQMIPAGEDPTATDGFGVAKLARVDRGPRGR